MAGPGLEESGAAEGTPQLGVKSIFRIDPVTQPKRALEEERLGFKGRLEYLRAIFAKRMAPSRQVVNPLVQNLPAVRQSRWAIAQMLCRSAWIRLGGRTSWDLVRLLLWLPSE